MNRKNVIIGAIIFLGLIGLIVASYVQNTAPSVEQPTTGRIGSSSQTIKLVGSKNSSGTLTPSYIETTTDPLFKTVQGGIDIDLVNVNLCATASSTAAKVNFQLETSDDNVNYFTYELPFLATAPTSTAQYASATTTWKFVPGSIEQRCWSVPIDRLNAPYYKFRFTRGLAVGDRNYGLYAEGIFTSGK